MRPARMPFPLGKPSRLTNHTETMPIQRQETLPEVESGPRRRVWCRGCRRELTDSLSRARGWGSECDPDTRNSHQRHDADQDPIPGL
jgi:hypothetical protein